MSRSCNGLAGMWYERQKLVRENMSLVTQTCHDDWSLSRLMQQANLM